MRRIALLIITSILLASCADTGAGGQVSLDTYSANGTALAVSALATGTAVSANSTRQAAEFVATSNAQATAAQSTAVAQATATEQAQLDSAAAIGVMTRDAITASQLQAEATATAVHLQLLAAQDAERAARRASTAVFWVWFRWALLGAFCFGVLIFIPALGRVVYYRWLPEDTAVYDADGNPRAFHHSYRALPATTIIQPQLPRITQSKPQTIMAERDRGYSRNDTAMPAPNSAERQNINAWLIAVNQGMSTFNRTGADTYRIGHVYADTLIDLAVRTGYAAKEGEHRTAPVIPCENFDDFINQFISTSPYSAMPMQENASPG